MYTQTMQELSKAIGVELKVRNNDELIEETFDHLAERLARKEEAARNRPEGVITETTLTPEQQRERMGRLD
jgi:hypothetical protein